MDFTQWFTHWLSRHPLKAPKAYQGNDYTSEVMAKIAASQVPSRAWKGVFWPRFAMVSALVAIALLVVNSTGLTPPRDQIASQIEADMALLAALDEAILIGNEEDQLSFEIELADSLILTASPSSDSDATWIEETIRLLDMLDEEASLDDIDETTDEDWLYELDMLDEYEIAS